MKHIYLSRTNPEDRRAGAVLIRRSGDYMYLDIFLWWWSAMINLWKVK